MTIFAFCKPMKAMNRPMPTLTAFFQVEGDGVEDSLPDIEQGQKDEDQPSARTAARATCQE